MWQRTRNSWKHWILCAACVLTASFVSSCSQPETPGNANLPIGNPPQATVCEKKVFNSPLAGQWYSGTKDALVTEIDTYLKNTDTPPLENVQALILPHAGYRYSGPIAAYGVKTVVGKKYSRVIVMGPSHHLPMQDVADVPDVTHYATLLGEVPLDVDFIEALKKHPEFRTVPGADEQEHSVQIQLPWLQTALGEFKFVPIVVGQLDASTARKMAEILGGLVDAGTLVVASSDFTHYGSNYGYVPFSDNVQENLDKLDMGAYAFIEKKDGDGFNGYIEKTGATICGRYPISVLLAMLPPESAAHLLKYDTSGRMTNDNTNSVSYLAIAFTGAWKKGEPVETKNANDATLSDNDKTQLLKLARGTLEYVFKNKKPPAPADLGIEITPGMEQVMGAFVSLKEGGQLRGCVGEIIPMRPLYKAVMAQAVNAAFNDSRFQQVEASELPLIEIEISAYANPPKPVASYKDIIIGKHGMTLEKRGHRALYLPQIAPEQGWGIEETLTHLATKAGLGPDDWKEGASFTVFEAIVFHEKEK